jgi:hypothetical protein
VVVDTEFPRERLKGVCLRSRTHEAQCATETSASQFRKGLEEMAMPLLRVEARHVDEQELPLPSKSCASPGDVLGRDRIESGPWLAIGDEMHLAGDDSLTVNE